ncbi:MAG: tetratricopeptide repeat protein [Rhodothermales bacterium]|nr:tetratricopeptide repeat protein [Rhodothermales bacterium]
MTRVLIACLLLTASIVPGASGQQVLGSIDFATSGGPEAHDLFTTGVLLLHSFEYEDAAEQFKAAQAIESDFAMAYWGEAMTLYRPVWNQLMREEARAVLNNLAPTPELRLEKASTRREKDLLSAAEQLFVDGDVGNNLSQYRQAMHRLHLKYPGDHEIAAFYALSILGEQRGTRDFSAYMRAAAIAEEVFAENPKHPGAAHYLIHSYDDPVHAPLGLRAAEAYSDIAPDAAHALHMPSHIFVALGMWDRVAELNERSWKAAEARRIRKSLGKSQRSFHAIAWLSYAYLQQGRFADSEELIRSVDEDIQEDATNRMRSYLLSMKAAYIINSENWSSDLINVSTDTEEVGNRIAAVEAFAEGLAAIAEGDAIAAERQLEEVREALRNSEDDSRSAVIIEIFAAELKAKILAEQGNFTQAVDLLNGAVVLEESLPFEYGPPDIVKPSHEMLGEVLLEAGRYDEAGDAFQAALTRAPKRALSLRGLAISSAMSNRMTDAHAAYESYKQIRASGDDKIESLDEILRKINE